VAGNIDTIRNGVNELAASDRLDKDSALAMTKLFHAMETLMRHECTCRDAQIVMMNGDMERARIQYELDRLSNVPIVQQQVDVTPLRRSRPRW
jgi:hypothetical protein